MLVATLATLCRRCKRRQNYPRQKATQAGGSGWRRILNPFKSQSSQYQTTSGDESAELNPTTTGSTRRNVEQTSNNQTARSGNSAGATIDRNTSVRSVLTLPAYSHSASNTERVIGREGDRDGVDIVVDFPTEEDEEALREQEMDALYQLRTARRQQHQERENLRAQRREAQQRNDLTALTDLRSRTRAASNSNNSLVDELRRDIDRAKENRQRSVSSVSYADLGVARHDGTRIRANSQESERMGLLSDAADMGQFPHSGANSPMPHRRDRSVSSVASIDSDFPSPAFTRPRGDSGPATPSRLSYGGARAGSSPELVESDLGVEAMPPPEYENVPLDDDPTQRSTTPLHEPPPDYPGPHRSNSQRSERAGSRQSGDEPAQESQADERARGRGVGGVSQLPSLRIGRLPEIVVEPSSAHPRNDDDEHSLSERL